MPGATDTVPSGISLPELDAALEAAAPHIWTPQADAILRAYYPRAAECHRVAVLTDELNRACAMQHSVKAVHERARMLGLQRRRVEGR